MVEQYLYSCHCLLQLSYYIVCVKAKQGDKQYNIAEINICNMEF